MTSLATGFVIYLVVLLGVAVITSRGLQRGIEVAAVDVQRRARQRTVDVLAAGEGAADPVAAAQRRGPPGPRARASRRRGGPAQYAGPECRFEGRREDQWNELVRIIIIAALAVTCSAFSVVLVRYENRQVYLDVRQAEVKRDRLNEEWGKLQLESATWSLHSLVALEARRELEMLPPPPGDIVVVRLEASR